MSALGPIQLPKREVTTYLSVVPKLRVSGVMPQLLICCLHAVDSDNVIYFIS